MAWDFADSFDLYATVADMTFGYWDTQSSGGLNPGRFPNSRSLSMSAFVVFSKASNVNDPVHRFVFAFNQNAAISGTSQGLYFTLSDGATAQCTVMFTSGGSIQILSGGTAGAVLATYAGAVTVINTWYAFEIEVVVNSATGAMRVRKNGNTSTDFDSGAINTRGGTANNYANKLTLGCASNGGSGLLDDFYWRSGAAAGGWMGDIRCYARMPAADVQAQFSRSTSQYTSNLWGGTGIPNSFNPNSAIYLKFVPLLGGTVAGFSFSSSAGAGGTGHVKAAIFSDNNGAVGTLLATSSEVVNPGAAGITCAFPTPPHVTANVPYWVGINQDASMSYAVINIGSIAPISGVTLAASYSSWPASNPAGTTPIVGANVPANGTLILVPGLNADAVADTQQDGVLTYVYDNNPGDADFYSIAPIPATPAVVFATVARGFMTKSDAGSRTASVQLRSGATVVATAPVTLTTSSWLWVWRMDLTDPNTGAAWNPAAVNAVQIGPKVVT